MLLGGLTLGEGVGSGALEIGGGVSALGFLEGLSAFFILIRPCLNFLKREDFCASGWVEIDEV